MENDIFTSIGECANDKEVVQAVLTWVIASDSCAKASDEDYPKYWRFCNAAHDRLHQYFADEEVEAIIVNKDAIRELFAKELVKL